MEISANKAVTAQLQELTEKIFNADNTACFIEREQLLQQLDRKGISYSEVFEILLDGVSTPIDDNDVFLGRVVEAQWPNGQDGRAVYHPVLNTNGHMTLDWPQLLQKGLLGIVRDARETAKRTSDPEAMTFATEAERCVHAVGRFTQRYVLAAQHRANQTGSPEIRTRLLRAVMALERVPMLPATDLFSALQSIWIVHLITSCYIGARDFAFGRLDQYLLPFYTQECDSGSLTTDQARELLAFFLLKTNEITGTTAFNYQCKPIPSQSSKQYLMLGGRDAEGNDVTNDLSNLILEAAILIRMPQPVLSVRLHQGTSREFLITVASASRILKSQLHFFNDECIVLGLQRSGISLSEAVEYAMVGCCRLDLPGCMDDGLMLSYHYLDATHWLMAALHGGRNPVTNSPWVEDILPCDKLRDFELVLDQFCSVCKIAIRDAVERASGRLEKPDDELTFRFESLLLRDCVARGKDYRRGGVRYRPQGYFLGGIATVANSLMAIKRLVFDQGRMTLPEFINIIDRNFSDNEMLRLEIVEKYPKFGNDHTEVDRIARYVGEIMLDVLEAIPLPPGQVRLAGFYSLDSHHTWGNELPATPDGRLPGEAVSENQSPSYGTDLKGITAVLNSVAQLPHSRTHMGGLNLKFGSLIPPEILAALIQTYFQMGGIHLGFTFVDRKTLQKAKTNPEAYRSLCVRLYGFSEYFVSLSHVEQNELIQRTQF